MDPVVIDKVAANAVEVGDFIRYGIDDIRVTHTDDEVIGEPERVRISGTSEISGDTTEIEPYWHEDIEILAFD